jgi:hypothetical protein
MKEDGDFVSLYVTHPQESLKLSVYHTLPLPSARRIYVVWLNATRIRGKVCAFSHRATGARLLGPDESAVFASSTTRKAKRVDMITYPAGCYGLYHGVVYNV